MNTMSCNGPIDGHNVVAGINTSGSGTVNINFNQPGESQCLVDLRLTDPRDDKRRIEDTKGGLLEDSYKWILTHEGFQQWHEDTNSRLLWIKGDPGKGKTMLLCGILNELEGKHESVISYFFCQATDKNLSNATAVLRGLIYILVTTQKSLLPHLQEKYNYAGKSLFEDANSWHAMVSILQAILEDKSLRAPPILLIDALDECSIGLSQLLDLINMTISLRQVKWIVSSRNWPVIEQELGHFKTNIPLCLELNADSVSEAIRVYIQHKVDKLAQKKKYKDNMKDTVHNHLISNADGTFLWVALVCQELGDPNVRARHTLEKLKSFPAGLDNLYSRMMEQINSSNDADLCKQIMAVVSVAYRPLTLKELIGLIEPLEQFVDDPDELYDIIGSCGSFLTLRDGIIYFIHQSAKDFLLKDTSNEVPTPSISHRHYNVFLRSLEILSGTLQHNIYNLDNPGFLTEDICRPNPDPLNSVSYSCVYWTHHFSESNSVDPKNGSLIYNFLKEKFLYWLEALGLLQSLSDGVIAIQNLQIQSIKTGMKNLIDFIQDAHRFILYHKPAIEIAPLQVYTSGFLFTPSGSLVKKHTHNEPLEWASLKPNMEENWSTCLQTLEGHGDIVRSVAFSPNSALVISGSYDRTIRIWRTDTGECINILEGHRDIITSAVFSLNSDLIASGSCDGTIRVWRADIGECLQTLKDSGSRVTSVAFSPSSTLIASGSEDEVIRVWRIDIGECVQMLKGHSDRIRSVAFSPSAGLIASGSDDKTVRVWHIDTGECVQLLKNHSDIVSSVTFSPDSAFIASSSKNMIRVWHTETGECVQMLIGHSYMVMSVAFSPNLALIASGSVDKTVRVWRTDTSECLQILHGHGQPVTSVAFSPDSTRIVSGSVDCTIRLWNINMGEYFKTPEGHSDFITSMAFSPCSTLIASGSFDRTVRVWRSDTGECIQILEGHSGLVWSIAFSPDSALIASVSFDNTVRVWCANTGENIQTLHGHSHWVRTVVFSPDSALIVSGSEDKTVRVWRTDTGECLQTLEGHRSSIWSIAFAPNSALIISGSSAGAVRVWDANTGEHIRTLKGHDGAVSSVVFSSDSTLIASGSHDKNIRVWRADIGECLHNITIGTYLPYLSFGPGNSYLLTDVGAIALDKIGNTRTSTEPLSILPGRRFGYGISSDGYWIISDEIKLIWLPAEYRPDCSAMSGSTIAIGSRSGKVMVIRFST